MSARSEKQIAVAMTERDERRFLAFLRTTADVQILALNSPSADHVWLNVFPPRRSQDRLSRGFVLWNRAFDWEPEIQSSTCPPYPDLAEEPVGSPIYAEHDDDYLAECLANLHSKGIEMKG